MDKKNLIRMAGLEKKSGIPRRTIHFYLQRGLLHAPMKTGRTMAYYDESHLSELAQIKSLREKGLPVAAIKARLEKKTTLKAPASKTAPAPKKTGKTRERILDVGCRIFRSKGYKQTKVSDITTAMGVGKGTFYFYFSDKKALFLECIPRIFNELFATGWDRIKKIDDAKSRLETRARMVLPVLREFCTILHLSKEAMEEPDIKIQALGESTYQSIRRPIAADIEKGIQQGIFRKTDVRVAASVFIGIMESLNDLRVFDRQPLTPGIWDTVSDLILCGLLPHSD